MDVGAYNATDGLTENADDVILEAHRDDVAVANGRNRHGAPTEGGGVDVEGEAGIVRRVSLVVDGHAGVLNDHVK